MRIKIGYLYTYSFLLLLGGVLFFSTSCGKDKNDTNNHKDVNNPEDTDINKSSSLDATLAFPIAYFSNPEKIQKGILSTEIIDKLIQFIDAAIPQSEIYVNIYTFSYVPVKLALKSADERGVEVHVLIDSSKADSWIKSKPTAHFLRDNFSPHSEVVLFHNDVAERSINHHKYILLSHVEIDGKSFENIVFTTSSNFTMRQLEVFQDAIVFSNEGLYNAMLSNWNNMKTLTPTGMKADYNTSSFSSKDGDLNVKFLPMRENSSWNGHHPVSDILKDMSDFAHDTILIGMSRWSDGNLELDIINKLQEMQQEGTHIEMILRYETGSGMGEVFLDKVRALKSAGANILFLPKSLVIHSKYMLIKGKWKGERHKLLLGGTTNYINPAIKNNNNLFVFLKDSPVFDDYVNNFKQIKKTFK